MSRKFKGFALLLSACAALPAWAGNGNQLHGIGAVNSSMGGAGVALPNDALGALNLNPALLTQLDGHRMEFSAELADDDITVSSSVATPFGTFSGSTDHSADPALIPAFGFTAHKPGSKIAFGVGFLGLAGFGADFPQDSTNPLLAPQPFGFGHIYSSYALMKVPTVVACQINDSLSIGGALVVGRASLTARPAGFAAPDCSAGGVCFVPSADNDSAWGFGAQIGLLYKVTDTFNIGFSYQSEMDFEDFEWNSAVANPNLPTFGTDRKLSLQVNNPANIVVGIGFTPTERLQIALDAKQMYFEDAAGFGDTLGWQDITAYALGLQFQATPRIALRLGYNSTEGAIPDEATFFNV
ncbi:MAG TPA: outer membrane protein transport protein, partial [Thermoanaerobaculia bacterium]|nr:outer membrane protein transport protein [Thermoanaerobaculia bacterium]